jgi:xylan 1,4-beta-xylosidase
VEGSHETVDVWITKKQGQLKILITNSQLPLHPVKTETIQIQLTNVKNVLSSFIERIDDTHANATKAWIDMGRPGSLSPAQVNELEQVSLLIKEPFEIKNQQGTLFIEVTIEPQGTACITLETE